MTLAGVLFAAWLKDVREQSNRDLVEIYERTYPVIKSTRTSAVFMLLRPETIGSWYPDSKITELVASGRLSPKRFTDLRADLGRFLDLADDVHSEETILIEATKKHLKEEADALRKDETVSKSLNATLLNVLENNLLYPLLKADRGDLFKVINEIKENDSIIGDKEFFGKKAVEIYDKVNNKISQERDRFRRRALECIKYTKSIEQGIELSLKRKGKRYRRCAPEDDTKTMPESDIPHTLVLDDHWIRTRILTLLYDNHQQHTGATVDMDEISASLGFSEPAVLRNAMYLSEKKYIELTWMAGKGFFRDAHISALGIDEIESREMKGV